MDIIKYLKENGNISFKAKKLNQIDEAIFTMLSYIDLNKYVSNDNNKVTLKEVQEKLYKDHKLSDFKYTIIGVQSAYKVFFALKDTTRYEDIKLYNYRYLGNKNIQFSCLMIDVIDNLTYVSFEGTDDLLSGWKEDFDLAYDFPVPAQRESIKYINETIPILTRRKYVLTGHSKGGNLAITAAMYAKNGIKGKIKKVMNFDGPGFNAKVRSSNRFMKVEKKLEMYIPNTSIVGLLMLHTNKYKVVKSTNVPPISHSILTWEIKGDKFDTTELSNFSKELDKTITDWMLNYDDKTKRKFVHEVFSIFERCNIYSLEDINMNKISSYQKIIKELKFSNPIVKDMLKDLLHILITYVKEDTKSFITSKIKK